MIVKYFPVVLLSIIISRPCDAFPKDMQPSLFVNKKATMKLPVFNGATSSRVGERLMNIQEIKVIDNTVLIGSRNAVYVISAYSFSQATGYIEYDQMLPWKSSEDIQQCKLKALPQDACHNYIRVIALVRRNAILLCGTNAASPLCREYKWKRSQFTAKDGYSNVTGKLHLPHDDVATLAYRYTDGYLYSATTWSAGQRHQAITRSDVSAEDTRYRQSFVREEMDESLTTEDTASPTWLNDPHFVGMVDSPEKVYVFFKEEAADASDLVEKVVHSRVARVCKQDRGGSANVLKGKWTSFFKARLNCSIPGNRPFYFNEIQHVTGPVILNGTKMVFVTMTTPENSILGSAVCAFTLYEIERVMAGNYKEQDPSSMCWKRRIPNYPNPLPTICTANSQNLDEERLQFTKTHSLMSSSVQPIDGRPLFVSTQSRTKFTAIAVEGDIIAANGDKVTVMYIGTNKGKLLKVTTSQHSSGSQRKTRLSEEWDAYQPGACSRKVSSKTSGSYVVNDANDHANVEAEEMRVRNVTLLPNSDVLLVTFQHCVISLPKQACFHYKCNSSCIQSGNPYCGWYKGYCAPLTSKNYLKIQQELFKEEKLTTDCSNEVSNNTYFPDKPQLVNTVSKEASKPIGIVLPLLLGLMSTFSFVLSLFLMIICCKTRSSSEGCCFFSAGTKFMEEEGKPKGSGLNERQSRHNQFFVRNYDEDSSRVAVGVKSSTEPLIRNRPDIGDPIPINNANVDPSSKLGERSKVLVVQNILYENQDNNSGEETTWSEDFFESDRSASDLHLATRIGTYDHSTDSATESSKLDGKARAVGVAHPISHKSAKMLQIVKPTFVTHGGSKVKLGLKSGMENYGSIQAAENPNQHHATPSRIMTNPNYLPVTPCIQRNVEGTNMLDTLRQDPVMKTFTPVIVSPGEKRKLMPENSCSFDLKFPPPPACVLSPSTEHVKFESFTAPLRQFPSPPGTDKLPPPRVQVDDKRFTPGTLKQLPTHNDKSPADLPSSTSGDSSSSGFVSSSPRSSFKAASEADRRACIVAKGILSAQTTLASPSLNRSKNKKKALEELEKKSDDAENIYDEVFDDISPSSRSSSLRRKFIQKTSDCLNDYDEISYQSPEFCRSSDDEGEQENDDRSARTPGDGFTPTDEDSKSKKKSLRLFRSSKKSKKDKKLQQLMQNDENFVSPSYDEDPIVPVVEGWEEIDYSSGVPKDCKVSAVDGNVYLESESPHFYDDSNIPFKEKSDSFGMKDKFAFHTMRPKNRMRQKMPKMRNTGKKWSLTNNPLPIPTPAVPEA